MGLFGPSARHIAELQSALLADINSKAAQGMEEFTVTVRELDRGRLDRAIPRIVDLVQSEGHALVHVNHEARAGVAYLSIRPVPLAAPSSAERGMVRLPANPAADGAREEAQSDRDWLAAGWKRFDSGKGQHFGSPETMSAGGIQALQQGDAAAAVFYFAKAIDIAQTWLGDSNPPYRRTLEQNVRLFGLYVDTIARIRAEYPDADLIGDWVNENGRYTANMMRAVAIDMYRSGQDVAELDAAINRFLTVTGMPVPSHW
jgi:hypothetical protein